jgi:hypothetical protein
MTTPMPTPQIAGCQAEQQHLLDPADPLFARLACQSDCCSTDADYPDWTPGGTR